MTPETLKVKVSTVNEMMAVLNGSLNQSFPGSVSYKLHQIRSVLKPHVETLQETEQNFLGNLEGAEKDQFTGKFLPPKSEEGQKAYLAWWKETGDEELELQVGGVKKLRLSDLERVTLPPIFFDLFSQFVDETV